MTVEDVLSHIIRNTEDPSIGLSEIEETLLQRVQSGELIMYAVPAGETTLRKVLPEELKGAVLRFSPSGKFWRNKFVFTPDGTIIGDGRVSLISNQRSSLFDAPEFSREHIERLWSLGIQGRARRRRELGARPDWTLEQTEAYVAGILLKENLYGPPIEPYPVIVNAVKNGDIGAWLCPDDGMNTDVTHENFGEAFPHSPYIGYRPVPPPGVTPPDSFPDRSRANPHLRFSEVEVKDMWICDTDD
jgi:hypothetical protein